MPPPNFGFETTAEEAGTLYSSQIQGKTILVTGVSPGGLGAVFAEAVAKHKPRLVILAGRDLSKVDATRAAIADAAPEVETRSLVLDLGSLKRVKEAAEQVNSYAESIDILLNNAGLMACPYGTTEDGLELQFGTNHIGHFLFTNLIMNKILSSGPHPRIINATSAGHRFSPIRFDDWQWSEGKTYQKMKAYGQSKTGNILFSVSLAEKLGKKGLISFSVHPGSIWTNLARHMDQADMASIRELDIELGNLEEADSSFAMKTPSQGTSTYFVAAFDQDIVGQNGSYLRDCQVKPEAAKPFALDKDNAEKLWQLSEEIVGHKFTYD